MAQFHIVNKFYGIKDTQNQIVIFDERNIKLALGAPNRYLANFAADMLDAFMGDYNILQLQKKIYPKGEFVKLIPIRCYVSPINLYNKYFENVIEKTIFSSTDLKKPISFKCFINNTFKQLVVKLIDFFPMTLHRFIYSKYCDPLVNAITIDFKHSVNVDNELKYVVDPNFAIFSDLAIRHGFKLDPSNPFRFVANLQSSATLARLQKYYNIATTKDIFKFYYRDIKMVSYNHFKLVITRLYDRIISTFPYDSNSLVTKLPTVTKRVKRQLRPDVIPEETWLKLYFWTRAKEEQYNQTFSQFSLQTKKIAKDFKNFGPKVALGNAEDKFFA